MPQKRKRALPLKVRAQYVAAVRMRIAIQELRTVEALHLQPVQGLKKVISFLTAKADKLEAEVGKHID